MEEVCGYLVLPSLQGYKVMYPKDSERPLWPPDSVSRKQTLVAVGAPVCAGKQNLWGILTMIADEVKREGQSLTGCHCGLTGSLPSWSTQGLQKKGRMPSQTLPPFLPSPRMADKGVDSKQL